MLVYFVYILLTAEGFLLLFRAIMSWVAPDSDGFLANFLFATTEPLVAAFNLLFQKLNIGQGSPIDMGFIAAVIAVEIFQIIFETMI